MDFKIYLQTSALEINRQLDEFFKAWSKEVKQTSAQLISLNNFFVEACQGGKRLRGTLVKLGFELTGAKYTPEILKPAIAYEIFQTSILAHDDIIDLSPLRRGKPTIYKSLGGNHYGISQTICLGDIGFFLAYKLISESNFSEENKNLAIQFFTKAMLDTGIGQMLDVALPHTNAKKTEQDVLEIFKLKTAHYTLVGPMQLGAILGGADQNMLANLEQFGESLGIAFQIQDDILGVFGTEEILGKPVTSDIEEGKLTLLYLYAYKNGGKKGLEGIYGSKVGLEELEKVRKIFVSTGALEYSQKKAEKLVNEAKKIIPKITKDLKYKKYLEKMADFLVKRDK